MTNEEANSDLGVASRTLAFALCRLVGKDWKDGTTITNLQACLFEYGKAIIHFDGTTQ